MMDITSLTGSNELIMFFMLLCAFLHTVQGYSLDAEPGTKWFVAKYGEDREHCGKSAETPCNSLAWTLSEISALTTEISHSRTIMIDAHGLTLNQDTPCDLKSIQLNTSLKIIAYNGKLIIGCSEAPANKLSELKIEPFDQETNNTLKIYFENVEFHNVIFNIHCENALLELAFFEVLMVDTKFLSPHNTRSLAFNFTQSIWKGHADTNCSFSCEPTALITMYSNDLYMALAGSTFLHSKITINASGLTDIDIRDCVFSNVDNEPSNHGEIYITVNNHKECRIYVDNCIFERQVHADPIQSIMNLYLAALIVRTASFYGMNPNIAKPIVNVTNSVFQNNERGLTFIGPFLYTSVKNCTFTDNIAMHAGAGILYLTRPKLTASYLEDCVFENNAAGSYRESKIDKFESSFHIIGDEVRIQSDCCKGLISFVGKGGAIRVQQGNLSLISSRFVNNTARLLGGAIFVDRESSLIVDDASFENTPIARHALQGDVFYSNGYVTIKSVRMYILTAINHVTILRHSGDHWSIEVSDIVIQCPIGYRLRVTNTSAYGVTPIGLRRSYKLDQLSYNCESCPRHKYSLDYGYLNFSLVYSSFAYYTLLITGEQPQSAYTGRYEYEDIECMQCPYGGRCQQGITAVPNFWGYIYNKQVRFQHCPKGYCCSSTSCESYNTCAKHRLGRLCGSCEPGYSEALFSSQCIRDDNCDSTWLWPLAVGTGLSYALFLLFQKDIRDLMFLNTVKIKDIPFPWKRNGHHASRANMQMMPLRTGDKNSITPLKDDIEIENMTMDLNKETAIDQYSRHNNNFRHRRVQLQEKPTETQKETKVVADTGASFLIILFYYFQDAQLLHIKTVFATEENQKREMFKEILSGLFKFRVEIFQFMDKVCFLSGITPTTKLLIKVILVPFVLLLFGIMYVIFRLVQACKQTHHSQTPYMNGGGMNNMKKGHVRSNATPKQGTNYDVGLVSNLCSSDASTAQKGHATEPKKTFASKLACGFVLSLLFTYQKLATTSFTLLNCVPVGDRLVLFIEGTVTCYNLLQYGIMAYTAVCIVPFFLVLLIGPGLLKQGYIGLPQFFCACIIPLPFLFYWVLKRLYVRGYGPQTLPEHSEEATSVMAVLQGPFKDNVHPIFGPLCGAGVLLGRRLVLILLFTFVNDTLIRMLCMMMVCFVILLHHVHVLPYKDTRGNIAGSASAAGLLIVGGINLVRAGFEAAEYDPMGPNKLLMRVFDEVELVLMLWFPAAVMGVAILSMTFKIILHILKYCLTPSEKHDHKS